MLMTGLSKFYIAKREYNAETNTTTFSAGIQTGGAMSYSVADNSGQALDIYMDDALAASIYSFASATLNHTTGTLNTEALMYMFNLTQKEQSVGDKTVKRIGYTDKTQPQELGFGTIYEEFDAKKNAYQYVPVILPKIKYQYPGDSLNTRGAQPTFSGQSLTAAAFKDEESGEWLWRYDAQPTRDEADAILRSILDVAIVE